MELPSACQSRKAAHTLIVCIAPSFPATARLFMLLCLLFRAPSRAAIPSRTKMADVVGILGFALHAAHKIYDALETIKDAPDEIKTLQSQAALVRAFLPNIQCAFEVDQHDRALFNDLQLQVLLEHARKLRDGVDVFLAKVTRLKADGSYEIRKTTYLFRVSDGRQLQKQFKRFLILLTAINTVRFVVVLSL